MIDAAIGSKTTRTRACDWTNSDGVGLCRMQERRLGGSSEKFEVFSPDVEHVGTGVLIAQETIAGQRVGAFSDETARGNNLVDIACSNVLLHDGDELGEITIGDSRAGNEGLCTFFPNFRGPGFRSAFGCGIDRLGKRVHALLKGKEIEGSAN